MSDVVSKIKGVRQGVETDVAIKMHTMRSSEVLVVAPNCARTCQKLGRLVAKEQLWVDNQNRSVNQQHPWCIDNVAASVVFCEGKRGVFCGASAIRGTLLEPESMFAGFEPKILPTSGPAHDRFVAKVERLMAHNVGVIERQ